MVRMFDVKNKIFLICLYARELIKNAVPVITLEQPEKPNHLPVLNAS
jgi:hypothetical protein